MKTIIGIDQSINSTGICICKPDELPIYIIISSKCTKKMAKFKHDRISYRFYTKCETKGLEYSQKEMAKFANISSVAHIIGNILDEYTPDQVVMEGISYGSVAGASLCDLSGLNYLIRAELVSRNIPVTLVTPMHLKSFAIGNGGASKDLMVSAWKSCDDLGVENIKIDDLADAYFLAQVSQIYKS